MRKQSQRLNQLKQTLKQRLSQKNAGMFEHSGIFLFQNLANIICQLNLSRTPFQANSSKFATGTFPSASTLPANQSATA